MSVALVGPAAAADMPVKAVPRLVAPVAYNWSGLYIGGHLGGGWSDKCFNQVSPVVAFGHTAATTAPVGLGGGQVGYNLQRANWLFGVEASASGLNISGNHRPPLGSINDNWLKTSKVPAFSCSPDGWA